MKTLIFVLLATLSNFNFSQYNDLAATKEIGDVLVGEWILDLRPSPDSSPYLQSLFIKNHDGKNFNGSFYGSPVKDAFFNGNWEKLYFAFKSSDSSSTYYQSGYIIGDKIYGTTYCPERNFVMPFTGKKKVD